MTAILDTGSKRRRPAKLAAGFALSAVLTLGTLVGSAGAQPRRDDHRGRDHRFDHHYDHRGYYPAPPVVYGGPVYAPPPVVYGPAVGIYLPGVSIGIQ